MKQGNINIQEKRKIRDNIKIQEIEKRKREI